MQPNNKRGLMTVKMKDGEKYLRFTSDTLCRAEKMLGGQSVLGILRDPDKVGYTVLRALLWAGLHGAGSKWSVEEVGNHMVMSKTQEYIGTMYKAFASASGMALEEDDKDGAAVETEPPKEDDKDGAAVEAESPKEEDDSLGPTGPQENADPA